MQTNKHKPICFLMALLLAEPVVAAPSHHSRSHHPHAPAPAVKNAASHPDVRSCTSVTVDPTSHVTLGKSSVIHLAAPAVRLVVGGRPTTRAGKPAPGGEAQAQNGLPAQAPSFTRDGVGDVGITLLSPQELFFLGKKAGSMNVILQSADGRCFVRDIIVSADPAALQAKLAQLLPDEAGIKVVSADNSLVLTGTVSDAAKLDEVMTLANAYADGNKIINMLHLSTPQQVMLEVKIAEVSKTLLDHLNIDFTRVLTSGDGLTSRVLSGIIGGGPAAFAQFNNGGGGAVFSGLAGGALNIPPAALSGTVATTGKSGLLMGVDAQKKDGLVRVLAEPNIMAISGQPASFLSGGKIFIPVAQNTGSGPQSITLEEKEFGVGLKFTPTVLDGKRINLKLVTDASQLSQTGSPFTTVGGVTSVLPSLTTRRADTTVQLNDGQSFAIAGLISNNITESIRRFPGLGDLPVLGALFRSTEFQKDKTELVFVVTPHLVKPTNGKIILPTDTHKEPDVTDALLLGKTEGQPILTAPALSASADKAPADNPPTPANQAPADNAAADKTK